MIDRQQDRIVLKRYNWGLPAVISLISTVAASLYALVPGAQSCIVAAILFFSFACGIVSIILQVLAARASVITFGEHDWVATADNFILEIESNFMLFRVETRNENNAFQEVMGSVETSDDGKITRIYFAKGVSKTHLAGRVIVR